MRHLLREPRVRPRPQRRPQLSRKSRAPDGGFIAIQAGIGPAAHTAAGAPPVAATVIGRTPGIDAGCTELQRRAAEIM